MTGVILQARLDSSRLPAKALLDLQGKTVVEHAMAALRKLSSAEVFILATDPESADFFRHKAEAEGFELFIGPKEDVLRRFADAARHYGLDLIVRATGDNPLVSWELAGESLDLQREADADYAACSDAPLGTGVEVIAARALLEADRLARDPYEREHVCPYLYRRPEEYKISVSPVRESRRLPEARVTVDTLEDYRHISALFRSLYRGTPIALEDVLDYLKTEASGKADTSG
ncbi:cytidylyltransferase domain-containing protein [Marispirochaeta aestuarii]|uniref:cytidylyltransferase domain-containing protein n=1 Tax=Marispirochaeta aestuarii TaxID=1963862 RepID=UPI0029C74567|nr:NTP transferase domain-containing protein [Marispirochaeta aestuarii]